MDLNYLHQSSYWLAANTDIKGIFYTIYLAIFSLLFVAGLGIVMLTRGDFRKVAFKYATPFILFSVLGWIYLFAAHEELPWLSTRLTLLLILAVFLLWILYLLFWSAKHVPRLIKEKKIEEKFNKYLPSNHENTKLYKNTKKKSAHKLIIKG